MTDRRWRTISATCMVLAFIGSIVGAPLETAIARGFFSVIVLGGLVAGAGLHTVRTQALASIVAMGLVGVQRGPGQSVADPPSPDWRVALLQPDDRAEARLRLTAPDWRVALERATTANVYVCAEGIEQRTNALILTIQTDLGTDTRIIGNTNAIGARPRPGQGGGYRMPIAMSLLQGASTATLSVAPLVELTRPISICGTHTIRPSWNPPTSVLIRGASVVSPGPKGPGRWVLELRLFDDADRLLLAWY